MPVAEKRGTYAQCQNHKFGVEAYTVFKAYTYEYIHHLSDKLNRASLQQRGYEPLAFVQYGPC